jgi:hypothetical protein
MNPTRMILAAAFAASLAGCAGSVSAPVAVQALDQKEPIHLSAVSADAAGGVEMSDADFGLICQKVKGYIQAGSPGVYDEQAASALTMKIHFTRFDRGNAFARLMLMGLGQIRIEADVDLMDASGKKVAEYKVAKDFSLGGVAGGTTTVEDVEDGFAKSVAEVTKTKA